MSQLKDQSIAQRGSASLDTNKSDDEERLPSFKSIKTKKKISLGVDATYTDWDPREAFREFIQNWRDAILESNGLAPKDLYVQREAIGEANGEATPPSGDTEIVYKAFRRDVKDSAECLGFVRYKGCDGQGTIEITNLRAALQTRSFHLGTTSKKHREDQAGAHGEGLKVAAINLMRKDRNYHVSGHTAGCKLLFKFDKDRSFPVQQEDFKFWIKVALFFTEVEGGDASIVSTVHGDLLISADQRGKLYLKGLLLSESTRSRSASVTGRPLGFGYNFASGRTNRDRRSLVNNESEAICKILIEALEVRPDQVGRTPGLLRIIKGMGKQPFHLSDKLWAILNYRLLVNTAEKEAQRRYMKAPIVPVPETTFATSLNRLLEACIRACSHSQIMGMELEFVDAGLNHLNLCVFEKTSSLEETSSWLVRIHKRWLSMDTAVAKLGLIGNVVEARAAVFAAKKLFSDLVRNVPSEKFLQEGSSELPEDHMEQQVQRADQRLENYQMMHVGIVDTTHKGHLGLTVEWTVNDGQQEDLQNIEIQCHRVSRCSRLRDRLLTGKDGILTHMSRGSA
ncbi:hypothetical protein KVR01_013544 [Diaporthe batatas]|uniref:uncharacterized protein n=1 Tax=Diaporthe batatas TaxID=748121 RepID=UPI001D038D78|nr:uncharacterized protein KVR01_013544 [Diaporthe batatas]KAG8156593.1 hypothetical protein KVR01_013544 [Diaporthe batatas]